MNRALGIALSMMGTAVCCLAGSNVVAVTPEIDSTSVGAAIALLGGGLLVIRYRREK